VVTTHGHAGEADATSKGRLGQAAGDASNGERVDDACRDSQA
jgi:hypothetical protein